MGSDWDLLNGGSTFELVPEFGGHVLRQVQRSIGSGESRLFDAADFASAQHLKLAFDGFVGADEP